MRALLDLLDLLWPRHCLACGVLLRSTGGNEGGGGTGASAPPLGLCRSCHADLAAIDPFASCSLCARPLPARPARPVRPVPPALPALSSLAPPRPPLALQRCGGCRVDPPAFDRLLALWRYESPLQEVIQAFKFGRLDFLGRHLAQALGRALAERRRTEAGWQAPDLVVPMPLPLPRRLTRGFNQTELLAVPLARELGRPCRRALARRFFTPRQTGQRRAGRARASHFRVPDAAAVAGRSILLLDDVLTTGATVRGASAALRRAGAAAIEVAVVGWTPLDGAFRGPLERLVPRRSGADPGVPGAN